MHVDDSSEISVYCGGVLWMSFGELAQSTGFMGLVVHEDRPRDVRGDCLEHALEVARPLERDLFVRAHASPAGDREVDPLEIKVIARIGQGGERCSAAGL